jgi:hypothetical protein
MLEVSRASASSPFLQRCAGGEAADSVVRRLEMEGSRLLSAPRCSVGLGLRASTALLLLVFSEWSTSVGP